jgi:hypothetical protein
VAHASVKVRAPASGGEQRRGGSHGSGGQVARQAGDGRRLDVAEAVTGARVTRLVYTSWVKPGSKLNLHRSLPDR